MRPSVLDGPGAVHIDRITNEIVAERPNTSRATVRLIAAALLADILDQETT